MLLDEQTSAYVRSNLSFTNVAELEPRKNHQYSMENKRIYSFKRPVHSREFGAA